MKRRLRKTRRYYWLRRRYYIPPRTKLELEYAWKAFHKDEDYFLRIHAFFIRMEPGPWYTLERFVRQENRFRFRDGICCLIWFYRLDLEFSNDFSKVRRCA